MKFIKKQRLLPSILAGVLAAGFSQVASAALSQQINQDAAGLGDAQAGSAASALDASTEFYNPAGLVKIKEQQVILGDNFSMPTNQFSRDITTDGLTETHDSSGGVFSQSPFLHYAAPISEQWAFGFGTSSPFAMHDDWSSESNATEAGRKYYSTNTDFSTYGVSTDLAYAVTKKFSVGAGFDFVRVIVSDYDDKSKDNKSYNVTADGSQWSKGWHGGVLYQFTPAVRAGVAYHSKVDYEVSGDATSTNMNTGAVLQSTNDYVMSSTLPAYTTTSIYVEVNPKLALEGSVTYTEWDQVDEITYQNVPKANSITPEVTEDYQFQNTWRTALGAHYTLTPEVMLRTGVGYETSPYSDSAETVYLAAPVGSSYDVSAGLQYKFSSTIAFDFGWTHVFYLTEDFSKAGNSGSTESEFSGSNDILGAQVRWDML